MKVAEVMTKDVATCNVGDSLNRAAQLMWDRRCGCLPAVDEEGRVVGMLTDRDVCMGAYTQGRHLDDIAVTTAMSRPARTCPPSAKIEDAEDLMMIHGVHRLVVVGPDGRPCGLVSLDDIAKVGAEWDRKGNIDLERVGITFGEIARRNSYTYEETSENQLTAIDVAEFVQNSLAAIKTLRDEIRVELNLAGKEARDRWRRLEARLHAAEAQARDRRYEAARDLAGLIQTLQQFRSRLREMAAATQQTH
jgi:CBS domain-containing protein